MKFLKLSLAASVALGALSTASFAQPLEEAIKGIDVSGYLRYRYNDDRYDNGNGNVDGSSANHQWRAVADFKTPVVNNIALNFGVWYQTANQNVNHGKGIGTPTTGFLGEGLGSGSDGEFGVREFYATITPDSTATTIKIGKQLLDTPVTNAYDGDRGTGILALNSDIPNLTLAAAAFDSWAINEYSAQNQQGLTDTGATSPFPANALEGEASIDKPLYALAGIYGVDTNYGRFGGQLWGFYIDDAVDALVFGELSWQGSLLRAKLQYTYAALNNDADSVFTTLYGYGKNLSGRVNTTKANISESNDMFVIDLGADFRNDFQIPLNITLGYMMNFADGTAVALEDEGSNVSRKGKIWWQNAGTGISTSALRGWGLQGFGTEQEVNVFYAGVDYSFIDERLNVGLEFAWGENDISSGNNNANNPLGIKKVEFTEITPTISWKHSKQLTLSAFYAFLNNSYDMVAPGASKDDQDRNRFRVEAKYSF